MFEISFMSRDEFHTSVISEEGSNLESCIEDSFVDLDQIGEGVYVFHC